jgi:MFS family permease
MDPNPQEPKYRWYILALAALTNTLVVAAPSMCLPVLFKEISTDLHLDLVQLGVVWGIGSLPGIVTVLVGGAIGDRFGPKRILTISCLLVGLTGAMRGLANDFISLAATIFLLGFLAPAVSMNTLKACGVWFSRRQLGLASGFLSMGMALGFMVGSLISATLLSPWLGGWRNVLFFYGVIGMALCIPWYFTRSGPLQTSHAPAPQKSMKQAFGHVARIRNVWLQGLVILGFGGCVQGVLGYLPLYLRGQGWAPASADSALTVFHTISMICVIPMALGSDRLGSRRMVLSAATLMMMVGVGLLSVVNGAGVWLAVCMAGMVRDGFMAVFITSIIETEGVGVVYAGTATGLVMVFSGIGSLLAPPLGNSLASLAPGLPFIFWAAMNLLALVGIYATGRKSLTTETQRH